ncbi:MAG: PIN domain nuclease [Mesorhizobium sp.]
MILPDTSAWIEFFRDADSRTSLSLAACIRQQDVIVGDLIIVELFQGLKHPSQMKLVSAALGWLPTRTLCSPSLAFKAAENYRHLRRRGVTVRGTIDVIIATWCIENGALLLHNDRDFDAMERELGLQIAR